MFGKITVATAGVKERETDTRIRAKTFILKADGENTGDIYIYRVGSTELIPIEAKERWVLDGPFLHMYEFDAEVDGESVYWETLNV